MAREDYLSYDKTLTGIAVGYTEALDPAASAVAPSIKKPWFGQYPKFTKASCARGGDVLPRAPEGNIPVSRPPAHSWVEYTIGEYPVKSLLDRLETRSGTIVVENAASKAKRLRKELDLQWASAVISAATDTSSINGDPPSTRWDQTGADPFKDITELARKVQEQCGRPCTDIVIPWEVVPYMTTKVQKEYRLLAKTDPVGVLRTLLPDFRIHIGQGTKYNSSTEKFASEWSDNVLLFHRPASFDDWEPAFMATIVPDDMPDVVVLKYEDADQRGTWVQVIRFWKVVTMFTDAAYLIKDVLT